jgi:hypothetical protein
VASRVGCTLCSGSGWLVAIEHAPKTSTVIVLGIVAVVALAGGFAVKIIEKVCAYRAEVTKTRCEHHAEITAADSEAETARIRAETRATLLISGDADMLQLEPLSADLPEGRRPDDNHLIKGLAAYRGRHKDEDRPDSDPRDPRDGGPGGGVVPFRRNDSHGGGVSALPPQEPGTSRSAAKPRAGRDHGRRRRGAWLARPG